MAKSNTYGMYLDGEQTPVGITLQPLSWMKMKIEDDRQAAIDLIRSIHVTCDRLRETQYKIFTGCTSPSYKLDQNGKSY